MENKDRISKSCILVILSIILALTSTISIIAIMVLTATGIPGNFLLQKLLFFMPSMFQMTQFKNKSKKMENF